MHFVPPGSGEAYYMKTLLHYVKGPTCYEDIGTIGKTVHPTFKEACHAMGLLYDDNEYIDAVVEASRWGSTHYLRRLFVILLVANQMAKPEFIWKQTWTHLNDDILHRHRRLLHAPGIYFNIFIQFHLNRN